jgi:hypothetical protein
MESVERNLEVRSSNLFGRAALGHFSGTSRRFAAKQWFIGYWRQSGLSQTVRAGVLMNSRNRHLTGLVVDAYLSRKIQKSAVASHANAVLPLSALASINSGRGRHWP